MGRQAARFGQKAASVDVGLFSVELYFQSYVPEGPSGCYYLGYETVGVKGFVFLYHVCDCYIQGYSVVHGDSKTCPNY